MTRILERPPVPLTPLFHHRWVVPVLAQLHRDGGAKGVTLVRRLGASRGAVGAALEHAIERGWVRRNPGYGHPLRPEYLLTAKGERLGPDCARLCDRLGGGDLRALGLRKWSFSILAGLGDGAQRFSDLKALSEGVTDRALALALRDLAAAGLVRRAVVAGRPPGTRYRLTVRGRALARLAARLRQCLE